MTKTTAVRKKGRARQAPRKLVCDNCRLVLAVDDAGDCADLSHVSCCGRPMRRKD